MDIFWNLVRFEYKKTFMKKNMILVLLIGTLFAVISVFGTIIGSVYVDGVKTQSNYEAMVEDREYERQLSGRVIDEELIMEAAQAYAAVPVQNTTKHYTGTEEYQNNARKYSSIYGLCRAVFNSTGKSFAMEDFQTMTEEEAGRFYEVRAAKLQGIESSGMSDKANASLLKEEEKVEKPFVFEYHGGYLRFMGIMFTTAMLMAGIAAITFASIFSGEYVSGADQLILSAKHGKGIVIRAKLFVVFSFTFVYTVLVTLITYAECMLVFGTDGKDAAIQLIMPFNFYHLTMGQAAFRYGISIAAACLVMSAITALLSVYLKSPFWTIIISCLLLIVPTFINVGEDKVFLYNLLSLLPSNIMNFESSVSSVQYELFGLVIRPNVFQTVFALILTAVLIPFIYRGFKRHQIT